jgi:hypothetical protein
MTDRDLRPNRLDMSLTYAKVLFKKFIHFNLLVKASPSKIPNDR